MSKSGNGSEREQWASRFGFILAAAGSAVGLGNIWKFPYITGENGGGLFVLIYLGCILLVGFPIMVAEVVIGRRTQRSPMAAFAELAGERSPWTVVGWLGVASGFVILSYYSVVAGWSLNYLLMSITDATAGKTPEEIGGLFDTLYASPYLNLFWHFIFMAATVGIVLGGVKQGIEKSCRILMPALFVILLILLVYGIFTPNGGFIKAASFVFAPNLDKLSPAGVLEALGHAFFTLSLGMGAMLTYGSYLSKSDDVVKSSITIVALDTLIALMACMVLFPILFSNGQEPAAGPGLVFKALPTVFSQIPFGQPLAILFFVLLTFAALSSAISLQEVVSSSFMDKKGWSRAKATLLTGGIIFVFGVPSALSGSGKLVGAWADVFGKNFFDTMDYVASNWMLTLGGLTIAIYAGWFMPRDAVREEFTQGSTMGALYPLWIFLLRFVAPLAVLAVLLYKSGMISL